MWKMHQRANKGEAKDFLNLTDDGGLQKKIVKEGNSQQIPPGVTAIVHYTGRLVTGEVFDSSRGRGKPFEFNIGRREVILGWDKGVASMTKGEQSILKCTPEYGYGSRAIGPIPANSTLLFEVELIDWKKSDETFLKKILAIVILGGFAIFILYMRLNKDQN